MKKAALLSLSLLSLSLMACDGVCAVGIDPHATAPNMAAMCAPLIATRDAGAKLTTPPDAGTRPHTSPSCPTGSGCDDAPPTSATSAPSCPAGNCD